MWWPSQRHLDCLFNSFSRRITKPRITDPLWRIFLHKGPFIRKSSPCPDDFLAIRIHDDVIKWKGFPSYRPFVRWIHRSVTRSFNIFIDLRLNKRLSKQSRRWWFKTPSRLLWCHCNGLEMSILRNLDTNKFENIVCTKQSLWFWLDDNIKIKHRNILPTIIGREMDHPLTPKHFKKDVIERI